MTENVTRETKGNEKLPDGWELAKVEQLGDVVTGNTPSTKERKYYGGSIPLFKPTDLNAGYWVSKSETTLTKEGAEKARVLPAKSVLVTCIGATIGKTGLSQVEGATNQQINVLVPSKRNVVAEYIYFVFVSRFLQDQVLSNASSTTLPILNKSKFSQLLVPLPPLNEQRRIVEKIEELFTKLDAGVRSLERARAQLKSYRRSVLKAAVEGELSREWREAHRDELEPASELLERILQERRERFAGKKYKEPASPDTSTLSVLPDRWAWATADQLLSVLKNGISKKPDAEDGLAILRISAVRPLSVDLTDVRYLADGLEAFRDYLLKPGDLLFTRYNGNPQLVGVCGVVGAMEENVVHPDKVIRGEVVSQASMPKLLEIVLNVGESRRFLAQKVRTTAGQSGVSGSDIKAMPVPLPPLEEQRVIVQEVERRLSVVDKLEATVEENLKQAGGLRQSILKRAFVGELVSQDPDDEPASALLERIREERRVAGQDGKRALRKRDDGAQGRLI